ncbi:MAG: hypothetical protein Q7U53_11905 [Anaerolineaceae bacterium]|nr:hypothetical protein [Anaerolineaceae bacterium]
MKSLSIIYHMARADFLERSRRYSFLVTIGLVLWLGYLTASGQFRMRVPPDYLGIINSAWIGATMTLTVTFFLGWVGFYLVKGSVRRDYETGVGQIMATTPLSKPLYTIGKWFSNFLVLGIMVLIITLIGILMNIFLGTEDFNLLAYISPIFLIAIPFMAIVAAIAVLFETISWLRGGFGNVVYFFLFMFVMIVSAEGKTTSGDSSIQPYMDFGGWQIIGNSVTQAAKLTYPESAGGFAFSITPLENPNYFVWNGIEWSGEILFSRFLYLTSSIGIGLLAAVFFDRFDTSRILKLKRKRKKELEYVDPIPKETVINKDFHLSSFVQSRPKFRFMTLLMTEFKLLIKGQRWWWYIICLGLIIGQLFSGPENTRLMLLLTWIWPVLILGGLGNREVRFNTRQIVFSAPDPIKNQLPSTLLSAMLFLVIIGSGAIIRYIIAGDSVGILGWLTGLLFIPSLAITSGVITGSSKTFEVIYILWMYLLTQNIRFIDFIGMSNDSPWFFYIGLALLLLLVTVLVRKRQIINN